MNSKEIRVWRLPMCMSAQSGGLRCPDNPAPDLTLTLTLTQTHPFWGARGLLSRSAGAVLSLRAHLKTLHVRANKRLVSSSRQAGGDETTRAGPFRVPPCFFLPAMLFSVVRRYLSKRGTQSNHTRTPRSTANQWSATAMQRAATESRVPAGQR